MEVLQVLLVKGTSLDVSIKKEEKILCGNKFDKANLRTYIAAATTFCGEIVYVYIYTVLPRCPRSSKQSYWIWFSYSCRFDKGTGNQNGSCSIPASPTFCTDSVPGQVFRSFLMHMHLSPGY